MSSSFDVNGDTGIVVPDTPLIRLLQAIAREWTMIAEDLNGLGAIISSRAMTDVALASAVELQAFDTIQQRAEGQASLLTKLALKIADDHAFDRRRLNDLLADIPFHSVRNNLARAFDDRPKALPEEERDQDDDIDWL